jgi:3-isopropylmalate/(R)-2-methylmalate dehydratase large subunit
MTDVLLRREVRRLPETVRFSGRVLYLTESPDLVRAQLAGENLEWDSTNPEHKLRDDISTDEITPAYICFYFDDTLGDFPYLGLKCRGEFPVTRGSVRAGGFVTSVAGKRRGKGSSREQSPYAEMCAGLRVVFAESFERIYRQNCQNLGVLTSTNFSLIDRVRRGEEIPLDEFTREADPITQEIIRHGGLFEFNVARLQGKVSVPAPETAPRPQTLTEKILAAHMVTDLSTGTVGVAAVKPGDAGFVRTDIRFSHEYVTPMAAMMFEDLVGCEGRVTDPKSIYFFRDHLTFLADVMPEERKKQGLLDLAFQLRDKQAAFATAQGIRLHGDIPGGGSEAICHSKVYQDYALPGQVIIGSDSHTPHSGALGCVAFGVGTTDVFNSWITKDVRVTVPTTVRIHVTGTRPANVSAKDFMLAILAHPYIKSGQAIGKVIEYAGPAVQALDIDERATMTNMAAEVGGFTGIVAPDEKTAAFLVRQRGMDPEEARALCARWQADPDAEYALELTFDASGMRPLVALPGDPGNGISVDELQEDVPIEIAYGGSCTAGKREDMDMYAQVLADGLARGQRVHPRVRFYIQFGAQEVKRYCAEKGYLEIFQQAGAEVIDPSCGACINAGPGASTRPNQIGISAQNRNFPGRSGPGQLYLASPLTVAASALAGKIAAYEPNVPAEVDA